MGNRADGTLFDAVANPGQGGFALDLKTEAGAGGVSSPSRRTPTSSSKGSAGRRRQLGVGYEAIREQVSDIVYCSLSGYGARPAPTRPARRGGRARSALST